MAPDDRTREQLPQELGEAQPDRGRLLRDLCERVKELECLYGVTEAVRACDTLADLFRKVCELIPQGWQHSEIARAKVRFEGLEHTSTPFPDSPWKQSSAIEIRGQPCGALEVHYLEERPELDEGPFSKEERRLLDCLSAALGDAIAWKRAEESLRASQEKYRVLVENSPDFVYLGDRSGKVSYINHTQPGHSREDVVGRSVFDFLAPEDRDAARRAIEELFRTGRVQARQGRVQGPGREPFYYRTRYVPIRDGATITGFMGISEDITERKREEAARRELEAQVQYAQKLESLGLLAGGIAHDFNNLLVGILGNADLALLDLPRDASSRKHVREIVKTGRECAALTRQMLAYAGKGALASERIDLRALVEDMRELLERSASKKTTIGFELPADLPAIVADPSQISQVLMNLVSNAAEAIGKARGHIAVTARRARCDSAFLAEARLVGELAEGEYLAIEVLDTGCGMDEAVRAKVFDPFFSTKLAGRGLGLAAVHGIVCRHKGGIQVESAPGKGTTFRVYLPVPARPQCAALPAGWEESDEEWRGSGTALLVDDEKSVRSVAREMLERLGFTVVAVPDGQRAIEVFRECPGDIACVLLDLEMPQMDGGETLAELRRIRADVPILLSSGYDEDNALICSAGEPYSAFIRKPYELTALKQQVRKILAS